MAKGGLVSFGAAGQGACVRGYCSGAALPPAALEDDQRLVAGRFFGVLTFAHGARGGGVRFAAGQLEPLCGSAVYGGHRRRHLPGRFRSLGESGQRLLTASEALREFQEEHGAIDLTEQTRATVEAIATLEAERTRLEIRRGVLEGFSHPDNVEMRKIDAELREIQKKLGEFTGRGDDVPLGSNEDGTLLPLASIPELVVRLADLTREVMVQENVRAFLSSQLEEARIQETRDLEIIHILDAAAPPLKKSRPRRSIIVLLSVGLAFVGSVGVAFAADSFLRYARGGRADAEFAGSMESKVLLRFARGLRQWGGPRSDEDST